MFDRPKLIDVGDDIQIAAYIAGEGPTVVFCHGFPELAFTWRHVLPAVARAGYRAIALDMRGYGASSRPSAIEDYDITHLTNDVAAAARLLGDGPAVFVGHDWGASVVWEMPLLHPEVTAGVIALNTPRWKYRRWGRHPTRHLRRVHGPEHYMLVFQEPGVADDQIVPDGAYERAAIRRHRRPDLAAFPLDPDSDLAHQRVSAVSNPPVGERCLSDEEAAYYGSAFRRTGFTGGLNWYRNLDRNAEILAGTAQEIDVPALMIAASHDLFNPRDASADIEAIGPDVERIVLEKSGHWLPDENRDDLRTTIIAWLERHRTVLWESGRSQRA